MARGQESGRSKKKLVEWLIVEVARNAGEDYIIRPPMDAMKDNPEGRKFWEAVVWNGQHNEGPFRVAMAGATGLTSIMIESLPFLSDFMRDQSQEVLEQLTNSLLIYCKKQDDLPKEPKPEIALDELIKAIPARFGEGWEKAAGSMEGTFKPFLEKFKIHLPGLSGKKDGTLTHLAVLSERDTTKTKAKLRRWLRAIATLPGNLQDDLRRIDKELCVPGVIEGLLKMPADDRTQAIEKMAPNSLEEELGEATSIATKLVQPTVHGFKGLLERRAAKHAAARSAAQTTPPPVPPTATP